MGRGPRENAPIGVFDSGVGGLTVLREVMRVLPRESTIYLGDNARLPYGGLPVERIRRYTLECLDYLYDQGVKALVLACNSATTAWPLRFMKVSGTSRRNSDGTRATLP